MSPRGLRPGARQRLRQRLRPTSRSTSTDRRCDESSGPRPEVLRSGSPGHRAPASAARLSRALRASALSPAWAIAVRPAIAAAVRPSASSATVPSRHRRGTGVGSWACKAKRRMGRVRRRQRILLSQQHPVCRSWRVARSADRRCHRALPVDAGAARRAAGATGCGARAVDYLRAHAACRWKLVSAVGA